MDHWLHFCDPVEEIEVHLLEDVLPALDRIEQRVEQEGLFAAGYVSYEAAPAFDDALQTYAPSDFPLLRFGLFAKVEQIELPAAPEDVTLPVWQVLEDTDTFSRKVNEIREAIARGETYQVNLTFPMSSAFTQTPGSSFYSWCTASKPVAPVSCKMNAGPSAPSHRSCFSAEMASI